MVLTIAPDRARWANRVRFAVLAVVALLAAHTIVYAGQAGSGERFAVAMSSNGHDGWWLPASGLVLMGGVALLLRGLGILARLEGAAASARAVDGGRGVSPSVPFRGEVVAIWRRLLPMVVILFALQENIEQLASHGRLPGIDVLIGPASPLALPAVAVVTLAIAAVGALVRWRIATLHARIRRAAELARRIVCAERVTRRWRAIGDLAPRRWMVDRLDAGRAPPIAIRP